MKALASQPNLVDQVREALLAEIASGQLGPGDRIIQEQVAQALGVSRQPVQQALVLLRNQGVLHDAPGRGLLVAPLDPVHVQQMYDLRAVIEGLAARRAAEQGAERAARSGAALIEAGRRAIAAGSVPRLIAADIRLHEFIHTLSGNPLIEKTLNYHLTYTQRVMGEVLARDQRPHDIWDQHAAIIDAIAAGDADLAEDRMRQHLRQASDYIVDRLRSHTDEPQDPAESGGRDES